MKIVIDIPKEEYKRVMDGKWEGNGLASYIEEGTPLPDGHAEDEPEDKFTLVGVDGNAYAVMGYTAHALKSVGLRDLVPKMQEEAMSSDYNNLLRVCMRYVELANERKESL